MIWYSSKNLDYTQAGGGGGGGGGKDQISGMCYFLITHNACSFCVFFCTQEIERWKRWN